MSTHTVKQSGSVTPGHMAVFTTEGVISDGGNVDASLVVVAVTTVDAAIASTIGAADTYLQVQGYATIGDGGAGLYKKVGSAPAHSGYFQSADGAYWELQGPVITLENFGAKGDGATDDTTALVNAIATAQIIDVTLLGSYGKTYKFTSQITITSPARIDFGGATLKFVSTTAAIGILAIGSVAANTTLAVGASAGARQVVVTSATGMSVGRYLFIQIWRDSPNIALFRYMTKIVGVSGTTITIDAPLPYDYVTGSLSGNTSSVSACVMLKDTHLSNAIFDLSGYTLTTGIGFEAGLCADSSFTNLKFINHAAADATSFFSNACAHCRFSVEADTCTLSGQSIDIAFDTATDCTIERIDSSNAGVFGPQIVNCVYSNFNNLNSEGAHGRSIKISGSLFSNFNNIVANNCSAAGATGLAITDSTSNCNFNGVIANGNTFGGTGEGIWFSDQYNINNRLTNWEASYNTIANVAVNTTDTGNVFVNGRTNNPANFVNTGNAKFIGLNGQEYTPISTNSSLVNGQNDNVVLPSTNWTALSGPTGAFSITGFAAPPLDGATLRMWNGSGQTLTLKHATGSSAGNQINTLSGANIVGVLFFELIYSTNQGTWMLMTTR